MPERGSSNIKALNTNGEAPCSLLLAPCYLITLSARARRFCGIVRPICFAACKLMTSSNFVGASMGKSAGFVPLRILSTYVAARRYITFRSGPYVRRPPLSAQPVKLEIAGKRFFTVNSTTRLRAAEGTAGPVRSIRPLARSLVADRNASSKSSGPETPVG